MNHFVAAGTYMTGWLGSSTSSTSSPTISSKHFSQYEYLSSVHTATSHHQFKRLPKTFLLEFGH